LKTIWMELCEHSGYFLCNCFTPKRRSNLFEAVSLHSGRLVHSHQRAGGAPVLQQLSARKYSNWALNTYTFIAPKVAIFGEKNSKIAWFNVSPKVRFTENIKIQSEPIFRGYSMNTLNTYRRLPLSGQSLLIRCQSFWCNLYSQTVL